MRTSRLFWKLFFAFAGLNLLSAVAFVVVLTDAEQERVERRVERDLHDTALVLRSHVAGSLDAEQNDDLRTTVERLGGETGLRVTIIDAAGQVLADSAADPAKMENHETRPEIVGAKADGLATSRRTSATVGESMFYHALRIGEAEAPTGFVRVAMPLSAIEAELGETRRLIWVVAAIVSLAGLLLTYWIVGRIVQPIEALRASAEAIAQGDYRHRAYVSSRDELGTLADVFNQMSAELARRMNQLRESSDRLSTVLGTMAEGVVAVDHRQQILFMNAAARELLAWKQGDEALGTPLMSAVRNHTLHQVVQSVLARGGSADGEFETAGPVAHIVAVHATRLPGEPAPGAVLVLRDVTELRRLERLRQEFVANVSHELKTPLSSIRAYTETLLAGALDDPEHRVTFLRRIEEQSERLQQLILDLLSLARLEARQQTLETAPLALADFVTACINDYGLAADDKHIALDCESNDAAVRVMADDEGLRQILGNLVDNAIKYTPEGGRVAICWRVEDQMVVIEVSDSGIGIPAEHQDRVFERFYRVDRARSRELGGTGLGLSIVKHLAQVLGGSVGLRSAPGEGSTFVVRLPLS